MTADKLLAELRAGGVELGTDGGRLRWRPASAVTDEMVELIITHGRDLIKFLAGREPCPSCRRPMDTDRRCPHCFDRLCVDCGRPSGSYFIRRCFPCGHRFRMAELEAPRSAEDRPSADQ